MLPNLKLTHLSVTNGKEIKFVELTGIVTLNALPIDNMGNIRRSVHLPSLSVITLIGGAISEKMVQDQVTRHTDAVPG